MYSLTIHFGPSSVAWAFLFKEKAVAESAFSIADVAICENTFFRITDDFGQISVFTAGSATGALLEDLELIETARIQRSLAEERCKIKLMNAAKSDPVIRDAMQRQGAPILSPMGGYRQN